MRTLLLTLSILILTAFPLPSAAQPEPVTLKRIMADPDWLGTPPRDAYWAADGVGVFYTRKRVGERIDDLWYLPLDGGDATVVELDRIAGVGTEGGDFNADRSHKAFVRHGDLYLQRMDDSSVRQLTRTAAGYRDPVFLTDGRIAVRLDNAIHAYDPESGLLERIAEIRFEKDPAKDPPKDDYLSAQQRRLLGVVAERRQRRDDATKRELVEIDRDPGRPARAIYLEKDRRLVTAAMSPDGRWFLVATEQSERDGKRDTVPFFVTDDSYVENQPVRQMVGEGEPGTQYLSLLDLASGTRVDLDLSGLPGIADDPLAKLREKAGEKALEGNRAVVLMDAVWNEDGSGVALMLRAVDNKDRWVATVRTVDHKVRPRHRLSDEAWINWYTSRDFFWFNDLGWMPDGETLWFLSEHTGWSQLYTLGERDRRPRALTEGRYEVSYPTLSPDGGWFYFVANAVHPGIHEVYRVRATGGVPERLTFLEARTRYTLSPDGTKLLLTSSSVMHHDELYLQNIGTREARRLTRTMSDEFLAYPWIAPQTVAVPSSHAKGRAIYSRVYLPPGFDATRAEKYPAVMFVHGAGYLQNVHYGWSGYFREFMFHTFLAEHGFVVIDMDYRASAGYGRDWRTAIYRRMGTPELEDMQDGVEWLVASRNVDPARVGVYGGSYGGFMAFMALFRAPDLFAAGAALRPVADWAHYHHGYTANILNTPELDPEAYERSSPIEFADGLRKPLLIISPMVDTNVLFKDVVRLTQRLIELEKTEHFTNALYPVENHGFIEPSSWLDEYRRIYMLFEEHLR